MSITFGVRKFTVSTKMSPFLRQSRFLNLGHFCLWNPESLKRLPLTKNPKSSDWNPNSTAWNPYSKTALYPLSWVTEAFDIALCNNYRLTLLKRFVLAQYKPHICAL